MKKIICPQCGRVAESKESAIPVKKEGKQYRPYIHKSEVILGMRVITEVCHVQEPLKLKK